MKMENYDTFWQRIHKSAKTKGFPLRVMFELTYCCNFRCLHCYVPQSYRELSQDKELKTKEVFCILDQLKDSGCFYLGFTGGEIFLRKDIMQILWYAKNKGFQVIINTNTSLIDEVKARELKRLGPNKIDITINSLKKDSFEQITQTAGSYKNVFKAIGSLSKHNIPLGFKSCVLKENENEIEDIERFADTLSAFHRLDDTLMPRLDGSKEPYKFRARLENTLQATGYRLQATDKDNLQECDFENRRTKIEERKSKNENLFRCGVGINNLVINPFGELKLCIHIDYPRHKILETSLEDCWQRLKQLVDNIKPDENYKCDTCELYPFCKWCPARGWLEDGRFTTCDPVSRAQALERMRRYNQLVSNRVHKTGIT